METEPLCQWDMETKRGIHNKKNPHFAFPSRPGSTEKPPCWRLHPHPTPLAEDRNNEAFGCRVRDAGKRMLRHCRVPVLRGCSKGRHRPAAGLSSNFTSFFVCKTHPSFPVRQFSSNFLLHPAASLLSAKRRRQPKLVFVQPRGPIRRETARGDFYGALLRLHRQARRRLPPARIPG